MTLTRAVARRRSALLLAFCAVAFLPGCGSSPPAAISASTASTLRRDVRRIRSAATDHQADAAHAAVRALRSDISRLTAQGALARSDARVLLIEAGQVDARVSVEVSAPAAASTTQTSAVTPTITQPAPAAPVTPGKGKGKDKGHGHGHGGD